MQAYKGKRGEPQLKVFIRQQTIIKKLKKEY